MRGGVKVLGIVFAISFILIASNALAAIGISVEKTALDPDFVHDLPFEFLFQASTVWLTNRQKEKEYFLCYFCNQK